MKLVKLLSIVVLLSLAGVASGDDAVLCSQACPMNEVYTPTKASCQPNCFTKNPELFLCGPISGCICKEGFIRNIRRICIPKEHCPNALNFSERHCPKNEAFGDGAACQVTCQTRELAKRIRCVNSVGCRCMNNLIRDSYTGLCMSRSACPKCLKYEEWVCGPNGCGSKGGYCQCKQGYIRNEIDDTCILDCDGPECKENEEFTESGSSVDCFEPDQEKANGGYKGCICKEGYAKNPYTQQCVLEEKCPTKCLKKNESYGCGNPLCEKTCENFKNECNIENIRCEDKCYCNPGFARNSSNSCVTFEHCQ